MSAHGTHVRLVLQDLPDYPVVRIFSGNKAADTRLFASHL